MRTFINRRSQKDVMKFVSNCLDCNARLGGGGPQMRPDGEEGTDLWMGTQRLLQI